MEGKDEERLSCNELKKTNYLKKGVRQMAKPTYQDATLMIQLAQWGSASGVPDAVNWTLSDEFEPDYAEFMKKYPPGSEGNAKVNKILGWYETIGTLYKQGLFNEELLFDWLAVYIVWDRVKEIALGWREQSGNPRINENFEALAKAARAKFQKGD